MALFDDLTGGPVTDPNTTAGARLPGSALGDVLSAFGGHPVDRSGLNQMVANNQMKNTYISAQTQEALLKAQRAQEEQDARAQTRTMVGNFLGPNNGAAADLVTNALGAGYGTFKDVLPVVQDAHDRMTLGDPNADPQARLAAQASLEKHLPTYQMDQGLIVGQPGQGAPQVWDTSVSRSGNDLREAQAQKARTSPQGPSLSDDAAYVAAVRYRQNGTVPPLGRDTTGADHKKVLDFAAQLAADPDWHPPSFDQQQAAPPGAAPPGAAPPALHPTLQNATDMASNPADMKAQSASLADMTKRTSVADSSEQTALKNLGIVREYLHKADQTGSPLINTILNKINAGVFGDPDVSAYQNAISTARNEYARVISMATGAQGITDAAMREGQKLFPDNLAPAQFETNFAVAQREMANRTGAMHEQITNLKRNIHTPAAQTGAPVATDTSQTPAGVMNLDDYLKAMESKAKP